MAKLIIPIWEFNESCSKVYLLIFNTLFSTSGILMICLGLWMMINFNQLGILSLECICNLPWLAIIFGFIVVGSAYASYLLSKKTIFLFMYSSCLFVLFAFGISMGILVSFYRSQLKETVTKSVTFHMENYLANPKDIVMDRLQAELECCGNLEPNDWLRTSTGQIPPSCCRKKLCDPTKIEEIYDIGCFSKVTEHVKTFTNTLTLAAIICSILTLLGCILTFTCAYHSVDKKYQEVE